jgi:hypothetical protein
VKGVACDTLLQNANTKLANRDSLIHLKDTVISYQTTQLHLKDKILEVKDAEIKQINLQLKREVRKKKWLKMGWGSTSVILGGALVYFMLN